MGMQKDSKKYRLLDGLIKCVIESLTEEKQCCIEKIGTMSQVQYLLKIQCEFSSF